MDQRWGGGHGQAKFIRNTEDWWALWIGLGVFLLSLGPLVGLALVYVVCLFGFIIWIGLVISWVFFHGIMPPTAWGSGIESPHCTRATPAGGGKLSW
ncbi:MAG: hypothetical protein ACHQ7N_19335 [Candidatus Methylomirabilales bacterium]